jgi:hypothetical protein
MELAALILIAVLVWYYGHSLKVASEVDIRLKSTLQTDLLGLKDALTQVANNITNLEMQVAKIDGYAHSADVEWKYFDEQRIAPMQQKIDEIGAFSISIESIHETLGSIERAVGSIATHPAFTWPEVED